MTVRRCALGAAGEPNPYPADAVLSLPDGYRSHGLRRLDVQAPGDHDPVGGTEPRTTAAQSRPVHVRHCTVSRL